MEIEKYLKAGEIAVQVKEFARGLIKPGMKLIDIAEAVDGKILELGGEFAFPLNLSLNEIAAHFTPGPDCEIVAEGILKVDIGVSVDGFIADTAFSVDLTEDGKYKGMIELNEKILSSVKERILGNRQLGIGNSKLEVKDVGDVVQDVLEKWNKEKGGRFSVIKSLSGHELGRDKIHAGLTISNHRNENETALLGRAVAIEPFVTTGAGDVREGEVGGIYVLKRDGQVRDRDGRVVLKYIKETFATRPFCLRFLAKAIGNKKLEIDLSLLKLRFILKGMVKQGILYEYPMLIEKSRGVVSQAEDTFLVTGDGVVCTTG
ncbi:MAG: type II methionyl aminopeptidase [Nanoarchaeota archaeon]|nr:type II methionyl aminopeptidase [Nanoarchaeota archaeon]